ncbi:hypothetical protein FA10DRAFT_122167 [Acaromyces ingoldii]|uniref:Uncharacterized protein n=1 Tax=Acaromyces ingoldii TaxID=215250 RepID=A0A316YRU8_9BASI|nr:hypothetical protein FA10DRAFT_122167 [Acaromyces ingoldii]PWN90723.1 hypothetical protein FA10DRAFT_122167 [Acaromyces ingoldii]
MASLMRLGRGTPRGLASRLRVPYSTEAGPSSSPPDPPRPRRRRRSSLTPEEEASLYRQGGPTDLVGPPDPISNIRPVLYARLVARSSRPGGPPASNANASNPHPYSTSEFDSPSVGKGIWGRWAQQVGERLQEAELQLRLARMSGDGLTQRFWRDNNLRFGKDLDEARTRGGEGARALPVPTSSTGEEQALELADAKKKGLESVDSSFYAQWLDANGPRHRAYNVLVWKQAALEVKLGARVAWLQFLLRIVGR